jgi:hypothetical protein
MYENGIRVGLEGVRKSCPGAFLRSTMNFQTIARTRTSQLLGLVTLTLLCCSCSRGPKLVPVRGTVLFQDKPAEGATVVFVPVGNETAPKPSGKVGADGTFTLATYSLGEGALPGDYDVVVTWYPPNARELENPRSKLPARYADPATSKLKATVKTGPTELEPFRLTK